LYTVDTVDEAAQRLHNGDVLAYPTEAVFGLGADPMNEAAVAGIFALKGRPSSVGVLLVASDFEQIAPLIDLSQVSAEALGRAHASWPGPMTWVFPRSDRVPPWVSGGHTGIALRVSAHAPVSALCQAFGGPIVSTSANLHGQPPALDLATLKTYFGARLDAVLVAPVGNQTRATPIRDVVTGQWLRE
jgi:L-threonylcarbamoyladenylate synthase